MTNPRLGIATMLLAATVVTLSACSLTDSGSSEIDEAWREGKEYGPWRLVFHGNGEVSGDENSVTMYPDSAQSSDKTHASLVVTNETYAGYIDFEITVHTEEHVRIGDPNPWEVGWVIWDYTDNDHFYALALKPNGWELSKQDPAYPGSQRFLASDSQPEYPIGQDYRVRIQQVDNTVTVSVDGTVLEEFTDTESPYTSGAIGLYNEDALVTFTDLFVHSSGHSSGHSL